MRLKIAIVLLLALGYANQSFSADAHQTNQPAILSRCWELRLPFEEVVKCKYSPDGRRIGFITSSLTQPTSRRDDGLLLERTNYYVSVIDIATGRRRHFRNDVNYGGLAFSSDSKLLVCWGADYRYAVVVDTCTMALKFNIDCGETANRWPAVIAFSANGDGVFIGQKDGGIEFQKWGDKAKTVIVSAEQIGAGRELHIHPKTGEVYVSTLGSGAFIFPRLGGTAVRRFHLGSGLELPFISGDLSTVVTLQSDGVGAFDPHRIVLWNRASPVPDGTETDTDVLLRITPNHSTQEAILDLALSYDGKWLAVLLEDGRLGISRVRPKSVFQWYTFAPHIDRLRQQYYGHALAFAPDGDRFVAMARGDSTLFAFQIRERN